MDNSHDAYRTSGKALVVGTAAGRSAPDIVAGGATRRGALLVAVTRRV